MNIKTFGFLSFSALAAAAVTAAPTVGNVQLSGASTAKITYDLMGGAGIVTMEIQTNTVADLSGDWVAINGCSLRTVEGDVSKLVQPGTGRTIKWRAKEALGGVPLKNARAVLTAWSTNAPPDYLVANLAGQDVPRYYTSTNYFPYGFGHLTYKTTNIVFKLVKAKGCTFNAGEYSYIDTYGGGNPHVVNMTRDYYLGIYELTQAQYHWATGKGTPWATDHWPAGMHYDSDQPASVGWRDNWRTGNYTVTPDTSSFVGAMRKKTGLYVELPTCAQWEFAMCCGGYRTNDGRQVVEGGEKAASICDVANVNKHYGSNMIAVGRLQPNMWGFYDMIGNVNEMCLDYVHCTTDDTPDKILEETTDPMGLTSGGTGYPYMGSGYSATYGYSGTSMNCYGQGQNAYGTRIAVMLEPPTVAPVVTAETPAPSALPTVASVVLGQDRANRNLVVTYALNKHAIVTWTLQTNAVAGAGEGWVDVPETKTNTRIWGDVNRLVEKTGGCSFCWNADETWPDQVVAEGRARAVLTAWPTNNPPLYMVVDLFGGPAIRYYTSTNALPGGGLENSAYRTHKIVMRKIPAKDVIWTMGIPADVGDGSYAAFTTANKTANTPHKVKLTYDYYAGIYELTRAHWGNLMNCTKGYGWMKNNVTFQNAIPAGGEYPTAFRTGNTSRFCGRLRDFHGAAYAFDLLSSAEWEYAYRAGEPKTLYTGKDWNQQNIYACGRFSSGVQEVGKCPPNRWGLYDLLGNAWDGMRDGSSNFLYWQDREDYKTTGICVDPEPSGSTSTYVGRGMQPLQWYQVYQGDYWTGYQGTVSDSYGYRIVCPIPKNAD